MYKKLILGIGIVIGGCTGLLLPAPSADAHSLGRTADSFCRNHVLGRVGIAVAKDKARERARRKWSYDAKRAYGYNYSGWQYAKNRDYHCDKKAGTWRCRGHANPCSAQAR
jgi:hypothetical protein